MGEFGGHYNSSGYTIRNYQERTLKKNIPGIRIEYFIPNRAKRIKTNLQKDALPMFHIDNIDWLEDTPDGKNTSHYLQKNIFQRKIQELLPIKLNIKKEKTESLKLKSNSFNEIWPYQKPNKSQFQGSPGCENFYRSHDICLTSLFDIWIAFRSFEQIVLENDISLQSPPRELNMQCINNDFDREQI